MHLEVSGIHAGFEYKVIRIPLGYRCGYVRIPEDHPWYQKNYFDIEVSIHGGLTYGDEMISGELEGYWVGFDCMHCFDQICPDDVDKELRGTDPVKVLSGELKPKWVKDFESVFDIKLSKVPKKVRGRLYVESQCKNLAAKAYDAKKIQPFLKEQL